MTGAYQILAAIVLGLLLATLSGCDGEIERLQAEADFNAKVAHALPRKGELVTIRQYADGRYVIRRYDKGLKDTYLIARDQ